VAAGAAEAGRGLPAPWAITGLAEGHARVLRGPGHGLPAPWASTGCPAPVAGTGPRGPERPSWPGRAIGVVSPYLAGTYYGALISSITRVAWQEGFRVVSVQTALPGMELHEGVAAKALDRVGWERLAGFVAIGAATPPGYLAELRQAGKPVVAIGHEEPGLACPVVLVDNRGGIRQVVEHLISHGHSRIAFAGCLQQFDTQERYDSYLRTLSAHGIRPDPDLFFEAPDNVEFGGSVAGRRLLDARLPSTAVVAATDLNAVGIIKVLAQAGYRLPADQAITGFDNIMGGALLRPSLSTVSQNFDDLGVLATKLLLRQLAGEQVAPRRHLVATMFVRRESCGCTRADVVAVPSHLQDWRDPVSVLCRQLMGARPLPGTASSRPGADEAHLVETVAGVAQSVRAAAAATGGPSAADLDQLSHQCAELCRLRPHQSTHDLVLAFFEHLGSQLRAAAGEQAGEVEARLGQCRAHVLLGLARASLEERNEAYYSMRRGVRDVHLITMDLLASREERDPRLLTWLERTEATAAVLGLWGGGSATGSGLAGAPRLAAGTDAASALQLVSTYKAGGGELRLAASACRAEAFPPDELLAELEEGCVVAVIPVASDRADWGLLAMVAPVDSSSIGQDMHFMWAALFAESLDHMEVTSSLRRSEERYALAVRAANDGLWDWDVARDRVYYSDRWKEMLGYAPHAIGEAPAEWLERAHPEDRPGLLAQLSELKLGLADSILTEHRLRARDGSYLWVLCRALAVPGGGQPAQRVVGSLTDVTGRHQLEDQLRHQALYDSLTGLPNRVLFVDRLSQAISEARRHPGRRYAVLWLDLDNFKSLNDTRGHLAGDQLLAQVAERIRANLREPDTAARFGGDEFAVLLLDVAGPDAVQGVAQRLLEDLRAPYEVDGGQFVVTGSVGVVMGTSAYETPQDVLRDADIAMYRAKSAGRGTSHTFGPGQ